MRTKQSLINIAVNLAGQAMNFLLAIISRSVLARMLPGEYLGINGLFYNVLNILSLAELGIGTAMQYAFYEPAAVEDRRKLQQLMNFYRHLYRMVAAAITAIGLMLVPFLGILVKEGERIDNLVLIYLLYLAQSVCSYFFVYKTVIITANQKQYICNLYVYACTLARYFLQIAVLLWTKDFMIYLGIQIFFTILPNILSSKRAERMYPYIREDLKSFPEQEEKRKIYKNIRAMFLHKIGSVLVYNTDNLIMSAFIGLTGVGIYSNYKLIANNLNNLLGQIFTGFAASIGNLAVTEDKGRVKEVFSTLNLACFLLYGYCCVAMAVLFRPFIELFFGERYILSWGTVLLLLTQFYLTGMRMVTQQFRNAMGIFWFDRYRPLVEVVLNLAISLAAVRKYGIAGILMGTVLSLLLIPVWMEPYMLFKYGIKEKLMMWYCRNYILQTGMLAVDGCAIYWLCSFSPGEGIAGLCIRGVECTVLYAITMMVCFGGTREWKELVSYARRAVLRRNE